MKKTEHGILNEPDIGKCPSCNNIVKLPRFFELDMMCTCAKYGAYSYGYKWLADSGVSAANRLSAFKRKVAEDDTDAKV